MTPRIACIALISCFSPIFVKAASENQRDLDAQRQALVEKARGLLMSHGHFDRPNLAVLRGNLPSAHRASILKKKKPLSSISFFKNQVDHLPKESDNVLRFEALKLTAHHMIELMYIAARIFIFGLTDRLYLDINVHADTEAINVFIRQIQDELKKYSVISKVSRVNKVHISYRLGYDTAELAASFENLALNEENDGTDTLEEHDDSTFGGVPFDDSFIFCTDDFSFVND